MTGPASDDDDRHSAFDAIEDRLQKAVTMLAVQAWRSSDVHVRDRLSSLAGRIRAVVDQYEHRRSVGVLAVHAADYLETLRRMLVASASCERRGIRLEIASNSEDLSNEGALVLGIVTTELVANALDCPEANAPHIVTVGFSQERSSHCLTVTQRRRAGCKASLVRPGSVGILLVRQLIRDLGGTLSQINQGASVEVRLSLRGCDLPSSLRNISPGLSPVQMRTAPISAKESFHELRHH
jgi:two-component sensor histidine kinase